MLPFKKFYSFLQDHKKWCYKLFVLKQKVVAHAFAPNLEKSEFGCHLQEYKPVARLVVITKELLLSANSVRRLHRHKPVSTLCMFTHQNPAFLDVQTRSILLQLLLWWASQSNKHCLTNKTHWISFEWQFHYKRHWASQRKIHKKTHYMPWHHRQVLCHVGNTYIEALALQINQISLWHHFPLTDRYITLLILTHRPWLLQYSSPVVRMHVPFFGSILHLHDFLCGAWCGLSHTDTTLFPLELPAVDDDAEVEPDDESLQIL